MRLCVIGDPISHSLSPAIHQAFMKEDGIEGTYEKVRVNQEMLPAFIQEAREIYRGFNVTMPLKEIIIPLLDVLDDSVHESVNTVVNHHGKLTGYNTDGTGFLDTLPFSPKGKRIAMLGYGGAGKELFTVLTTQGADVQVFLRDTSKKIDSLPMNRLPEELGQYDLLVNATPQGLKEEFSDLSFLNAMNPSAWVYDLVYLPETDTKLIAEAKKRNLPVISGKEMLLAQAKRAYKLFTCDRN